MRDLSDRRRKRRRRFFDYSVPSPCVALCQIDETTGLCRGCFRNCDEIRDWMVMTREDKLAVLDSIKGRKGPSVKESDAKKIR